MTDVALKGGPSAPSIRPVNFNWLGLALVAVITVGLAYVVCALYVLGEPILGSAHRARRRRLRADLRAPPLLLDALHLPRHRRDRCSSSLFPVVYTIYLGFTNYSSFNLLTFERAQRVHLSSVIVAPDTERPFALVSEDGAYRVFLPDRRPAASSPSPSPSTAPRSRSPPSPVTAAPAETHGDARRRPASATASALVTVTLPDGTELKQSGLRTFASVTSEYDAPARRHARLQHRRLDPDAGPLARLLRQRRGRRPCRPAGASTSASPISSASSRPKASARRCSRSSSGR